jgi:signal transduction histidine kinase
MRAAPQQLHEAENAAAGIPLDLDNVEATVVRFSELLRTRTEGRPNRRVIHEVTQAGQRSAALTRHRLELRRRLTLTPQYLDLVHFVTAIEPEMRARLSPNVELALFFDDTGCFAHVDPPKLREIILSLIDNANRAMPDGGRLILELSEAERPPCAEAPEFEALCPGRYARLAVIDAGIGIDEETRARLFEPISKRTPFDRTTEKSLATANAIVHQSGGCIRIESVLGAGTAVEIFLPSGAIEQAA